MLFSPCVTNQLAYIVCSSRTRALRCRSGTAGLQTTFLWRLEAVFLKAQNNVFYYETRPDRECKAHIQFSQLECQIRYFVAIYARYVYNRSVMLNFMLRNIHGMWQATKLLFNFTDCTLFFLQEVNVISLDEMKLNHSIFNSSLIGKLFPSVRENFSLMLLTIYMRIIPTKLSYNFM